MRSMLELCLKTLGSTSFGVAHDGQRIYATSFGEDSKEILPNLRQMLPRNVCCQVEAVPSVFVQNVFSVLKDVYDGKDATDNISLAMERFPAYTQLVLRTVSKIPVGFVASYGAVADTVGGGARAVGNVMANNAFAPIVPCHRVVTSNLGLGGYGGGLRVKYEFLKREKRGYSNPQEVLAEGMTLKVFPVEIVLQKLEKPIRT